MFFFHMFVVVFVVTSVYTMTLMWTPGLYRRLSDRALIGFMIFLLVSLAVSMVGLVLTVPIVD